MEEVCVTGASGYIASHIIKALLRKGYHVRATVRHPGDNSRIGFLWELPGAKERLQLVAADLLKEGSFDDAVDGCRGVFHVASAVIPRKAEDDDPQRMFLKPSLNGTLNVLNSCYKASASVKRVVLTSSCSAIRYDYNKSRDDPPLDESCWSNPDYCQQFHLWYAWAKTLAEQAAWSFSKEHNLDLVVVNPSFVVGPMLSPTPSSSIELVLRLLKGELKTYPNSRMGFVHIDDVVKAHLLAYETSLIRGRLICSGDVYHWHDITKMIKEKFPTYPIPTICGVELGNDIPHTINTSKLQTFGFGNFKSLEEMFDDCIKSFKEIGLLN